jgi:hypothetical protein
VIAVLEAPNLKNLGGLRQVIRKKIVVKSAGIKASTPSSSMFFMWTAI